MLDKAHITTPAPPTQRQSVKADVDLRLAGRRHLVVLPLDMHAEVFEEQGDLVADILLGIRRRNGEVPLLGAGLVGAAVGARLVGMLVGERVGAELVGE